MPWLPSPGTPAYTAVSDQVDAAQRDATERAAALRRVGALEVDATGPWASAMLDSASPRGPGRRLACVHVANCRSPMPVYVPRFAVVVCEPCLARHDSRTVCQQCDASDLTLLPYRLHIAQRGFLLAHGPLCPTCSDREHHPD